MPMLQGVPVTYKPIDPDDGDDDVPDRLSASTVSKWQDVLTQEEMRSVHPNHLPFVALQKGFELKHLSLVLKNAKELDGVYGQGQEWSRARGAFFFKNKSLIPLQKLLSLFEKDPSRSLKYNMISIFEHAKKPKDFTIYLDNPTIKGSNDLLRAVCMAAADKDSLAVWSIKKSMEWLGREETIDMVLPKLRSDIALRELFEKNILKDEDVLSSDLIGPWISGNRDNLLLVLHEKNPEAFTKKITELYLEKQSYTVPFISRQAHLFNSVKELSAVLEKMNTCWSAPAAREKSEPALKARLGKKVLLNSIDQNSSLAGKHKAPRKM